jgi:phosphomannomutase
VQRRSDIELTTGVRRRLTALGRRPPGELGGQRVLTVSRLDGVKFLLEDGGWCLVRRSGTEPLLRINAEARTAKRAERLLAAANKLVVEEPSAAESDKPQPPRSTPSARAAKSAKKSTRKSKKKKKS